MNKLSSSGLLLVAVIVSSGCAAPARVVAPTSAAEVGEFRHGFLNGYLPPSDLPDSLALIRVIARARVAETRTRLPTRNSPVRSCRRLH
jgi:hypothetical protein